jgi:hypothetical protein
LSKRTLVDAREGAQPKTHSTTRSRAAQPLADNQADLSGSQPTRDPNLIPDGTEIEDASVRRAPRLSFPKRFEGAPRQAAAVDAFAGTFMPVDLNTPLEVRNRNDWLRVDETTVTLIFGNRNYSRQKRKAAFFVAPLHSVVRVDFEAPKGATPGRLRIVLFGDGESVQPMFEDLNGIVVPGGLTLEAAARWGQAVATLKHAVADSQPKQRVDQDTVPTPAPPSPHLSSGGEQRRELGLLASAGLITQSEKRRLERDVLHFDR